MHNLAAPESVTMMMGLYLAHLVESHWDELEKMRAWRTARSSDPASYDAWKRL